MKLLLNKDTEIAVERLLSAPSHALMLIGPEGSGKLSLARYIASRLLDKDNLENAPYYKEFAPINGTLTIDQVRDVRTFKRLKTTGRSTIRRVVLLQDAHLMNIEAQNALLKVLEEPPADSVVLLTVAGEGILRPTIYSRTQRLTLRPISLEAAVSFFGEAGHSTADITRAYNLSNGTVGLIQALLEDGSSHPLTDHIELAKEIFAADRYHRLIHVDALSKDKDVLPSLLYAMKRLCSVAMDQAASRANPATSQRWLRCLTAVYAAEASLPANPNSKLLLTDLFLQL
jgi:DNA polymerase-3 subunit delta'